MPPVPVPRHVDGCVRACYEDFRKIKEIAAATYTCISSFKKPVFRPLWTGLFTFFHGGNNVVYDAFFLFRFVLFCFVLFCLFSFFFFFAPVVFYSCFIFFGGGRGDFSSCASDESSSEHIKLASVTLASIVSISMSEIVSTVLLDTVGMLMMAKNASNI